MNPGQRGDYHAPTMSLASTGDAGALPASGRTRRPFVGRQQEFVELCNAFDAAASGEGSLFAVLGEPGIGKTTLCEQLADFATLRGGRALFGHCYEEGSLALPYLPFVQALRRYILERDVAALKDELGAGATELARIVPEVTERIGVQPAVHGTLDAEERRYQLLQAVTDFVVRVAASQPLLVVLEDLHDADHGTLDLLVHLSRQLDGSRLLVVGTYRDIEVDRAHPLSATLAQLRRSTHFGRVQLSGLTTAEVQELLSGLGVAQAGSTIAEAVHKRTEGNPLFVREVARFLRDESTSAGTPAPASQRWTPAERARVLSSLPEGLRDVIGNRLSRLSPGTNRLLTVAAVIGREFDLVVLQAVAALDEDALTAALEEAVRAGVLQEHTSPGTVEYRFSHAFVRQTLYEELIAPRRLRLHQQVARALEVRYAGRLQQHAAELAEHFAQSTDAADLTKAIEYFQLAARAAVTVFAFGEAARQLTQALQVLEVLDPDAAARRCDLYLELGEVLIPAGRAQAATEEVAPQAQALAETLGDARRMSRAAQLALEGMVRYGGMALEASAVFRTWAERADRYAEPDSVERVYADHALGNHQVVTGDSAAAFVYFSRALALARQLGDAEALYRSAWKMVQWTGAVERQDLLLALAKEVAASPRTGVNHRTLGSFLWYASMRHLIHGDRARFEELSAEVSAIAERTRDPGLLWRPLVKVVIERTLEGELEAALQATERLIERTEELGIGMLGRVQGYSWSLPIRQYLGSFEDRVDTEFNERFQPEQVINLPLYALRGDATRAHEVLRAFMARLPTADAEAPTELLYLLPALEGATLLGDRAATNLLRRKLVPAAGLGSWLHSLSTVGRVLGDAAVLCGDPTTAARGYYEQGLQTARALGHRPETALLHLSLAELLARDHAADPRDAQQHLELAIPELQAMHMRPALERALRLHPPAAVDPLTSRERDVVVLIAEGRSNRAIAERLVITEGTAEVHVKHILTKLGLKSRTQVALWAAQRGLIPPQSATR